MASDTHHIQTLHWGIIGCGDVAERKSGPAFNLVSGSALKAVMRRNGDKARDYALRHDVPKWYNNAEHLIDDPEINAIYIATPPSSHAEYAIRCLEKGKYVYLEKPMARHAAEAEKIARAVKAYHGKLCVAHYRRAQPMFIKIGALLDQNLIGDIRFITLKMLQPAGSDLIAVSESNWRLDPSISGGGLFHDLAPHQLDLMIHFFGKVRQARGFALNQAGMYAADDLVAGEILFENGIVFQGTWCFSVSPSDQTDSCEIIGSRGKISFPVFGSEVTVTHDGETSKITFSPLAHVQEPMIERVCAYFLDKGPNPCSAEAAIASMEIIDAFTRK